MKTTLKSALTGFVALFLALGASAYSKSMFPYTLPSGKQGAALGCTLAQEGMRLELGKWYTNFEVCKKYADENGIPLFSIWSNEDCIHCWYTDICFIQDAFVQWQKETNAGQVICCFMAGKATNIDQQNSPAIPGLLVGGTPANAYQWSWKGGGKALTAFPMATFWWKEKNINVHITGDDLCKGSAASTLSFTDSTIPLRVTNLTAYWEKVFKDWVPTPPYAGGKFTLEETETNRLEAEASTTEVSFDLARDPKNASLATNNVVQVIGPDGKKVSEQTVEWKAGEASQTVTVDIAGVASKDGDKITLLVVDAEGVAQSTGHVTYVDQPVSAVNPLWLGERTAPTARGTGLSGTAPVAPLQFGEWTMDLDTAKALAASAAGDAYTLVLVEGSLWCPDCKGVYDNFLSVADTDGSNKFEAWAKSRNVALVAVDVGRFTNETAAISRATLLSREAINGASGLGYLTRKGVSDADAAAQLEKNRQLVTKNTAEGGVHRPEDASPFRTGVPMFALLRKDGSVAARLTEFWNSGSKATKANFDNYVKRLDEMLLLADAEGAHADDIENDDASSTKAEFAANGGSATGELSHCDDKDVFKLAGVGGNALQKVTVKGTDDVDVSVQFLTIGADGKSSNVCEAVKGVLSQGVALDYTFTSAGDYFVKVSVDSTAAAFNVAASKAENFSAYSISGAVVMVPQQEAATGNPPSGSDEVVVRLEKGALYRFTGIDAAASAGVLEPAEGDDLYTAKADGDQVVKAAAADGAVTYQLWVPGTVGFVQPAMSVKETDDERSYDIAVARGEGRSGDVTVRVKLNKEKTTLVCEDAPRFVFEDCELTWAEGDNSTNTVTVAIKGDTHFDGPGDVVLDLEVVSGADTLGTASFTLSVTDNNVQSAGKVAVVGADPFFSKKLTVYAKASEGATFYAERIEASDGAVSVQVKASDAKLTLGGDIEGNAIAWANRKGGPDDRKAVTVGGLVAGKSYKVVLEKPTAGFQVLAASNAVTIVAVADTAPEFATPSDAATLYRYVASSNVYALKDAPAGKVTFTKTLGTLPAGLKATYDAAANALVIAGAPTAKAGAYTVVYQVKDGAVAGLTKEIAITLVDPTDVKGAPETANASVASARTFKDIPIVNPVNKLMAGTLQLTIPAKGNVSGKYTCESGAIALTAKGWSAFDPETKELAVTLAGKNGFAADVVCADNGEVTVSLDDPMYEGVALDATVDGASCWSKANPATAWQGYYTAALPMQEPKDASAEDPFEAREGLAPRGAGYLTLKMSGSSACNAGKVTWAGMLPNGATISGSSSLTAGDPLAKLPIFKVSKTDTVTVLATIEKDAVANDVARAVRAAAEATPRWVHCEKDPAADCDYYVDLGVYGGVFDAKVPLADCCQENYQTTSPILSFDTASLLGWTSYGVPGAVAESAVTVGTDKLTKAPDAPAGMTIVVNRATGVVSGAVKIPYGDAGKTITATWKGVILQGWGPDCGCAPGGEELFMPFVTGAYYFADKVNYEVASGTRTVEKTMTVKRGGLVELK